jgi:hypothetical protein
MFFIIFIDMNSFLGGLKIPKRELCVKAIWAEDLGFIICGGLFGRDAADFPG